MRLSARFVILFAALLISLAVSAQTTGVNHPVLVARKGGTLSSVNAAASPDGKWFATEAQSGAITIWSTDDGTEYRIFQPFPASIPFVLSRQLAVASDAQTIAVVSGVDLHLIDVNTAKETLRFPLADGGIWKITAHPNQLVVAAIENQGTAKVFSLRDGHQIFARVYDRKVNGSARLPYSQVAFSPDGRLLALATDESFELWDWAANKRLVTIDAHSFHSPNLGRTVTWQEGAATKQSTAEERRYFFFTGVSFSPDGQTLALTSYDEVNILKVPSGKKVSSTQIATGRVPGCFYLKNDQVALSQGDTDLGIFTPSKRSVRTVTNLLLLDYIRIPGGKRSVLLSQYPILVDERDFNAVKALLANARPPTFLAFTPDARQLLWGTWFKPLTSWNLESGEAEKFSAPGSFSQAVMSENGRYLAEADPWNGQLRLFDFTQNREEAPFPLKFKGLNNSLAVSPEGVVGVTQRSGQVDLVSMREHRAITHLQADHPTRISINPDGKSVAIGDLSGTTIYSLDSEPKKMQSIPLSPVPANTAAPFLVQFSPGGQLLAIMETIGVRLVSTQTWKDTRLIDVGAGCTDPFVFSPSGDEVAFTPRNAVEVMETNTGRIVFKDQDLDQLAGCPIAFTPKGRMLLASTEYGAKLMALPAGETLASLYLYGSEKELDWLVVTPDGLFDGTPNAWKQVSWRFSDRTFDVAPVEIFFRNFYHPGLLSEIISGHAPKPPSQVAHLDVRQVKVGLRSSMDDSDPVKQRTVKLELSVQQLPTEPKNHLPATGARDLRLFRNGTLVRAWRGDLQLDKSGKAVFTVETPIVAGENRFTAYGFTRSDIKSADASLTVTGDDVLQRKGVAYVIAVGINHYAAHTAEHPLNLNFAEADATDFAAEFRAAQRSLGTYSKIQVIRLMGDDATSDNLKTALNRLSGANDPLPENQQKLFSGVSAVQPEDGVFIFYAGHGAALDGRFYLIPHDYDPSVPLDDPRSRTVSDLDLSHLLEGISPGRSFLIIDACKSGQAITTVNAVGPINSPGLAQLAYDKGLYIMAASKDSEPALEDPQLAGGHGYLTYALIEEGIKRGAAAANGSVELRSWFAYASRRVPQLQGEEIQKRALLAKDSPTSEAHQHPRIFYRREPDVEPFVVAKTLSESAGPR